MPNIPLLLLALFCGYLAWLEVKDSFTNFYSYRGRFGVLCLVLLTVILCVGSFI